MVVLLCDGIFANDNFSLDWHCRPLLLHLHIISLRPTMRAIDCVKCYPQLNSCLPYTFPPNSDCYFFQTPKCNGIVKAISRFVDGICRVVCHKRIKTQTTLFRHLFNASIARISSPESPNIPDNLW